MYDFAINPNGTFAELLEGSARFCRRRITRWYAAVDADRPAEAVAAAPGGARPLRRRLPHAAGAGRHGRTAVRPAPAPPPAATGRENSLSELLAATGFDREQHEQIRADLRSGRTGLAQNRLPASSTIQDAAGGRGRPRRRGELRPEVGGSARRPSRGEVAVLTPPPGAGSRWTQGPAVEGRCTLLQARRPPPQLPRSPPGQSRKTSRAASAAGAAPRVHQPPDTRRHRTVPEVVRDYYGDGGHVHLSPAGRSACGWSRWCATCGSPGRSWPCRLLDEQRRRSDRACTRADQLSAVAAGEGSDYTDNLPSQCVHPVGHWFELPNLLRNGVLARLLAEPGPQAPDAPQHRHRRCRPRPGGAGAAPRVGRR